MLALVEGVLVDAEVARAVQGKALGGLADGELTAGEGAGADAVVVALLSVFPEWLGAVPSGKNAGELRQERPAARHAEETVGVDDEARGLAEAVEVTDGAPVSSLAEQPGSLATGAAAGRELR